MKSRLNVSYNYEFHLIAIVSSLKEYKLAWHLNNQFDIDLEKKEDVFLEFNKGGKIFISNYLFETNTGTIQLLKNKPLDFSNIANPYLLSELKNYDYLLKLEGEIHEMGVEDFHSGLKVVNNVQFISTINVENLKYKDNLIF